MRESRASWALVIAVAMSALFFVACGRAGVGAGFLMGDAAIGCVWGEEVTGERFNIALPRGWKASADPVAVIDDDGNVFVREGQNLAGSGAQFPWTRSEDVLCEVEGAVGTVRFSEMETPSSHLDDELGD